MSFMQLASDRNKVDAFQADTCTEADNVSSPADWADEMAEMIGDRPIAYKVVNPRGPGGGWPVIEYSGPEWALLDLLDKNFNCPPDEAFETFGIGPMPDSPQSMESIAHSVRMLGTPDKLVGLEDAGEMWDGWDWIAGYAVVRTGPGDHGGKPATRITLGDSDGQREVGRLVLRNDALRGSVLEWVRQFESDEARDAFVARLAADSNRPGEGWVRVEARTVNVGDTVQDPSDDTQAEVQDTDWRAVGGLPAVVLIMSEPINDVIQFQPTEEVWVRRA